MIVAGTPPWLNKKKGDSSSDTDAPGGYRLKSDPTLPAGARAVVNPAGKREAVVKPIAGKWAGSWDNYKQQFGSAQAALKHFGMTRKMNKDGGGNPKSKSSSSSEKSS